MGEKIIVEWIKARMDKAKGSKFNRLTIISSFEEQDWLKGNFFLFLSLKGEALNSHSARQFVTLKVL
ncbi:hypothetical protein ACP6PL_08685 [Dapis sp. BLCC M126]|uniref:hypothetical protein n=1 Tax=Dapis sp. BLCC M126 TaxID=3400189 RepID=UPI003CEE5425